MLETTESKVDDTFKGERPKNWILESILVMLLIMLPCGLVALVYGCKVDKRYNGEQYSKSLRASKLAARWNLAGLCTGIPLYIWYYFFVG